MKICDYCEEEWEEDFFCAKCSGLELIEVEAANVMWDGFSDDEFVNDVEWVHQDVCLNCCTCHLRGKKVTLTASPPPGKPSR